MDKSNFLPDQYDRTNLLSINHNYLSYQFADCDEVLAKIREVVLRGDFTLGRAVDDFEARYAEMIGVDHAVGVGSGTDALFLSLKVADIGSGDEVITTPFTFYATIGAIVTAGARPVFVDIGTDYNIDADRIEAAITPRTKAILPVHWSGKPCRMGVICDVAERHGLKVIEDACHAIGASYKGQSAGSFGIAGCFSMHPLKNLNVWGDGGVICTNDTIFAKKLRLIRNHGLVDRDTCKFFSYNSRLDTVQAVVAAHLLDRIDHITERRICNASYMDAAFSQIPGITIPQRDRHDVKQVYHIYSLLFERRDELQTYLIQRDIDAKVHYPTPMHLQPAASSFGYRFGDFPVTESVVARTLSLPVHEFITRKHCDVMIAAIRDFYE
ncbi:MAG: pyridoxal-5'-phosphate-dependent protein [Woeseia sp.]|nr:pyridoxal-5'-phosphate-dependent protein [Woeseia sp.]